MEPPSVAEQRATAVAWLKRAASLPRMKDGRRPPMHVEAVSEGERVEKPEEESAQDSDEKPDTPEAGDVVSPADGVDEERVDEQPEEPAEDKVDPVDEKAGDVPPSDGPPERPSTPGNKRRRSRSRARSRGSKDLRNKPKTPPPANESSADEYAADDAPPSPPLISPIPSHFAALQASRFLPSPISPGPGMFHPITSPSTPMPMPTLEDIVQKGLFRSNSVGAARMMAMSKLTGERPDISMLSGGTPLGRNNTVSGGERGERIAARRLLFNQIAKRVEKAETDQTSGTDDMSRPATPGTTKRRKRRSKRSSSRASTVLDDRDEREHTSASNTPLVPPSPLPHSAMQALRSTTPLTTPVQQQHEVSIPMGGRGVVIEDEDEDADRGASDKLYDLPTTPARRLGPRIPHSSDAPSQASTDSTPSAVPVPFYLSTQSAYKHEPFPASPFATPLREKPYLVDEDEESDAYRDLRMNAPSRQAFPRESDISWVAEPGAYCVAVSYRVADRHFSASYACIR